MTKVTKKEGWVKPWLGGNSAKYHYFKNDVSLCNKWKLTAMSADFLKDAPNKACLICCDHLGTPRPPNAYKIVVNALKGGKNCPSGWKSIKFLISVTGLSEHHIRTILSQLEEEDLLEREYFKDNPGTGRGNLIVRIDKNG